MSESVFITGTDTGVGKTYVAVRLIQQYIAQGYKVVGMKPVAAGCEMIDGIWQNEDVVKLMAASNVQAPREWVNPYSFDAPIAPHIAAAQQNVQIDVAKIQQAYKELQGLADIVIVEGAGGLLVPIDERRTMADIVLALNLPVVLVVNVKLGCINHTLLTAEALKARQIRLSGWVANVISPLECGEKNIETLAKWLGMPPLILPV
ncbi:MAG TPA: dethiobiotin synthase [Methylophilus sp.]|nr:dethiobiotin synthase [Methylophilus sp.]